MTETKISSFIIGLILVSVTATILTIYIGNVGLTYGVNYDNSTYAAYNKLDELTTTTSAIQAQATSIKERSGSADILGDIFGDAYRAIKVSVESQAVFNSLLDQSITDLKLGASGTVLRVALSLIVLILLFVGVLLSAVLKWSV